jgi:hypothetical protein
VLLPSWLVSPVHIHPTNIRGLFLEQLHQCNVQQILDEEKSKHASLAQQNGFGPAFLHRMLSWQKAQQSLAPTAD